jgi:quercetin dioxygenase-like cupin family protein
LSAAQLRPAALKSQALVIPSNKMANLQIPVTKEKLPVSDRHPDVQNLIDAHRLVSQALPAEQSVKSFFAKCHAALEVPGTVHPPSTAKPLAVCGHLTEALRRQPGDDPLMANLCAAFERISAHLTWRLRTGLDDHNTTFMNGHGNAVITGMNGLEGHHQVLFGVSLVAPGVTYPNHWHPPEEGYLVIGAGAWRQEQGDWQHRNRGQTIHNPPHIVHAMRATASAPLLALWMLWLED